MIRRQSETTNSTTRRPVRLWPLALLSFVVLACDGEGGEALDPFQPPASDDPSIDLAVAKSVNSAIALEGAEVTFTIGVRNSGPVDAVEVMAADTLPTGLTYVSHSETAGTFSPPTGLWTIGDLAVDQQVTLTLTAAVASGTMGSTLTNTVVAISTAQHDSALANNFATASVRVRDPGAAIELAFHSDWGTGLGNSEDAIKDGGAWGEHFWCGGNMYEVLSVVGGAPLGWTRTPNVFATQMRGGSGEMCGAVQRQNAVPASTTHWGRLYFRNDDDEWGGAEHNFSYNFVGSIQIVYHNLRGSSQGVRHNVYLGSTYPYTSWHAQRPGGVRDWIYLENETWYRYEWMVEYVTDSTIRFWPRIYSMDGELLLDSDDYYQLDHPNSGPHNLTSWYAAGNTFSKDPELMRHIGIGNEGRPGPNTGKYWYTADFALSLDGWIGDN
jgi:uncharacterized repeat protein (TIGR01451 family)